MKKTFSVQNIKCGGCASTLKKALLEDFGEAMLVGDNGATNYFRVDWYTPDGLSTWGDGRTIILGTKGYIELRKYVDIARDNQGDHVYVVNDRGEKHFSVNGQVGYPFFGELILDCLHRTEQAMTQASAWLIRATEDFAHSMVLLKEARNVKYADFVAPGHVLSVTADIRQQGERETRLSASGWVDGRTAVSARLILERFDLADTNPEDATTDIYIKREMRKLFAILYRGDEAPAAPSQMMGGST